MKKGLITLFVLLMSGLGYADAASAAQAEHKPTSTWTDWPVVGQATLSWFWLDIYSSQLRAPDGQYHESQDISPHSMALEIRYLRNIKRQQLIDATKDQWHKLGFKEPQTQSWLDQLQQMLPDVSIGDRLIYVSDGKSGEFFFAREQEAQQSIGVVTDESFNDAFLSIWLSPQTEYLALRNQLIGMNR
ncbi:periplasmic protein [Vibrio metoecus]|nr:periplasmic protein [Vibrio metoecus]